MGFIYGMVILGDSNKQINLFKGTIESILKECNSYYDEFEKPKLIYPNIIEMVPIIPFQIIHILTIPL